VDSPKELIETVDEIRAVTERTGAAARYCADMVSADIHSSLPADMQRAARRIMADIKYTFTVEGEDALNALPPRTRSDLFLFFKETLVNISRHSGAGSVTIDIAVDRRHARLTVTDDGVGIPVSGKNGAPPSLKRRARLLRAQVSATPAPGGGARIELSLPLRRWGRWR